MMHSFSIGDKVALTPAMKRASIDPEKYGTGIVMEIGSWGVVKVLWNGIDHPIAMRSDEIAHL